MTKHPSTAEMEWFDRAMIRAGQRHALKRALMFKAGFYARLLACLLVATWEYLATLLVSVRQAIGKQKS